MVALPPRECLGIESPWDTFPAPAKTGITDPITLAPFHSLPPPGQTETNSCRIKVLSSPMVAWAASAEQVMGLRGYYKEHPCQSQKRLYKAEGEVPKPQTVSYLQDKGYFVLRGVFYSHTSSFSEIRRAISGSSQDSSSLHQPLAAHEEWL